MSDNIINIQDSKKQPKTKLFLSNDELVASCLARLSKNVSSALDIIQTLTDDVEALNANNAHLQEQINQLREEKIMKINELNHMNNETEWKLMELDQRLTANEQHVETAMEDVYYASTVINKLMKQVEELTKHNNVLQKTVIDLENRVGQLEIVNDIYEEEEDDYATTEL